MKLLAKLAALVGQEGPGSDLPILAADLTLPEGASFLEVSFSPDADSALSMSVRPRVGRGANAQATGDITAVTGAELADDDNFTLDDGVGSPRVFEFDNDAALSIPGAEAITFVGAETLAQVRQLIIDAINDAENFYITAEADPEDVTKILLTNDFAGEDGNTSSSEDVVDGTFAVSAMAGGVGAPAQEIDLFGGEVVEGNVMASESIVADVDYAYNFVLGGDTDIAYLVVGARK